MTCCTSYGMTSLAVFVSGAAKAAALRAKMERKRDSFIVTPSLLDAATLIGVDRKNPPRYSHLGLSHSRGAGGQPAGNGLVLYGGGIDLHIGQCTCDCRVGQRL